MRSRLLYFFRKYALLRFVLLAIFFLLLGFFFSYLRTLNVISPVIDSISPNIFEKTDNITIYGKSFGVEAEDSFLKIDSIVIPSSLCKSWDNERIELSASMVGEGGLLFVIAKNVYSNPIFLPLKTEIPIVKLKDEKDKVPSIDALSKDNAEIGQLIKIYGNNFGNKNEASNVFFIQNSSITSSFLFDEYDIQNVRACSFNDIEFWNEEEIHIRIPDSAQTGSLLVKTLNGISNSVPFNIRNNIGEKALINKREFIFSIKAEVSNIKARNKNTFLLRTPLPFECSYQSKLQILNIEPAPLIQKYNGDIIHKIENVQASDVLMIKSEHSIVTYEINTKIHAENVSRVVNNQKVYNNYTTKTSMLPIDSSKLREVTKIVIQNERNPYLKARRIYNYLIKNFKVERDEVSNSSQSLETFIDTKKGSPYDMSLLFATLCRIENIPTLAIAGITVDKQRKSYLHWWNEFYLEGFGWVPVDIGMALSIPFNNEDIENKKEYYFGNLDSSRIAFSNQERPVLQMIANSKTYGHERSFAFLNAWEETVGIDAYTCFWHIPAIISVN